MTVFQFHMLHSVSELQGDQQRSVGKHKNVLKGASFSVCGSEMHRYTALFMKVRVFGDVTPC